jgi:hypothetical protein
VKEVFLRPEWNEVLENSDVYAFTDPVIQLYADQYWVEHTALNGTTQGYKGSQLHVAAQQVPSFYIRQCCSSYPQELQNSRASYWCICKITLTISMP